jgi:hypothetical protein
MRGVVFVVVGASLIACKGESTPSCEEAVKAASKKVARLADSTEMSKTVASCIRDRWSADMRSCFAHVRDEPDALACILRHAKSIGRGSAESKRETTESKREITMLKVRKYAFEGYPSWAAAHADKQCPDTLAALNEYVNDERLDAANDEWGHPLKMTCGPSNPPGVKGLGVMSLGEDGQENTADDIKSWE